MTVPDGITKVRAVVLGGGGGGLAQHTNSDGWMQAGSGGGYSDKIYTTSGGATISITVGTRGAKPASNTHGTGGGAGGTSTVTIGGVSISATGGLGGILASSGTSDRGGVGSGGDINTKGGRGGFCPNYSSYDVRNNTSRIYFGGGSSGTPWGDGHSGGLLNEGYATNSNNAGATGGGGWGGAGGTIVQYINGAGTGGGGAGGKAPDSWGDGFSGLDYSNKNSIRGGIGRGCRGGTNESNTTGLSQVGMVATPYVDGEDAYWFNPEDIGGGGGAGARRSGGGAAGSGGAGAGGGGADTSVGIGGSGNGGFGGGNGGCGANYTNGGASRPGNGGGHGCFKHDLGSSTTYSTYAQSGGGAGGDGAVLIYW